MSKYYKVGKIVNTHGVRGEVRVISTTDFVEERYTTGKQLYFFDHEHSDTGVPLTIKSHRVHKQFDLLSFEDHPSINEVEKYKGGLLKVAEEDREDLPEGEYYYDQIIGCSVVTEDGTELGKVKEILSPGANDVWVIQRNGKGRDLLLPYIPEVILNVSTKKNKITIHLLEGLIDE